MVTSESGENGPSSLESNIIKQPDPKLESSISVEQVLLNRRSMRSYKNQPLTINGKTFRKDLIILPEGTVLSPWQRKSGHRLEFSDLEAVLDNHAKTLVIGTGKPGLMRPHATLVADLQENGITAIVMSSKQAAEKYNTLAGSSDDVAACFHLTC